MFYDNFIYRVKMGYVDPFNRHPHDTIEYRYEEHGYMHDLSYMSVGRAYTSNKLADIIPLDIYLKLPSDTVSLLIEGLAVGMEDRANYEKDMATQREIELKLAEETRQANTANAFNQIKPKE